MRRTITRTVLMLVAALFTSAASAAECVVADPTGTKLNVRSAPQGAVVTTLGNGTAVDVVDGRSLNGKRWAKVSSNGAVLGWVFAAYLDCSAADDRLKSAPMRPRTAPQ